MIAGTDCGFETFLGPNSCDPEVAWLKLEALVEGARIASQRYGAAIALTCRRRSQAAPGEPEPSGLHHRAAAGLHQSAATDRLSEVVARHEPFALSWETP